MTQLQTVPLHLHSAHSVPQPRKSVLPIIVKQQSGPRPVTRPTAPSIGQVTDRRVSKTGHIPKCQAQSRSLATLDASTLKPAGTPSPSRVVCLAVSMADHNHAPTAGSQHDQESCAASKAASGCLQSFEGFRLDQVLKIDTLGKAVVVLGRFEGKEDPAIAILAYRAFDANKLSQLLTSSTMLESVFVNDIYSKYAGTLPPQHALVNVDIIYPATDKHIQKYVEQPTHMIAETPEIYQMLVKPYIHSIPPARIQWVYNILEKKAEVERLLFEDPDPQTGFMMHPDLKWDQSQRDQLYCLALVHRRDLASLRDLTSEHLPLLQNIKQAGCKVIEERLGVQARDLRIFFHYPPSYYHLHVHFAHIKWLGFGAMAGKAVLLDDVIDNITLFGGSYYQQKTLHCTVGEEQELWQIYQTAGS